MGLRGLVHVVAMCVESSKAHDSFRVVIVEFNRIVHSVVWTPIVFGRSNVALLMNESGGLTHIVDM